MYLEWKHTVKYIIKQLLFKCMFYKLHICICSRGKLCLSSQSVVKCTSIELFRHVKRSRIQAEKTERASKHSSQDQAASNEEKSATAAGDVSGHCFE